MALPYRFGRNNLPRQKLPIYNLAELIFPEFGLHWLCQSFPAESNILLAVVANILVPLVFPALTGSKRVSPDELIIKKLQSGRQTWDDWAIVAFAAVEAIASSLNPPDSPPSQSDSTSGQLEEQATVLELPASDLA